MTGDETFRERLARQGEGTVDPGSRLMGEFLEGSLKDEWTAFHERFHPDRPFARDEPPARKGSADLPSEEMAAHDFRNLIRQLVIFSDPLGPTPSRGSARRAARLEEDLDFGRSEKTVARFDALLGTRFPGIVSAVKETLRAVQAGRSNAL